jgi:LemA protein
MEPFDTFILKRMLVQIGGIIAIAAILGGFVLAYNATYSQVVNLDQQADERWARIQHDMVGRYAGIPGVVDGLRPSLGPDAPLLDQVTRNLSRWRTALTEGGVGRVSTETSNLEAPLSSLSLFLEGQTGMEKSQAVRDFMGALEKTDMALSADQVSYNEGVRDYNRVIRSFPASLWAENWGFAPKDYFTARIGDREPPPLPEE